MASKEYIGFGAKENIPPNPNYSDGKEQLFKCYPCNWTFDAFKDLTRHNNSAAHLDDKYRCPICPNRFKLDDRKKAHMKEIHGEKADDTKEDVVAEFKGKGKGKKK